MVNAKQLTAVFSSRPEVLAAYVFGSVASGRARTDSDIDIGVLIDPKLAPGNPLKYRLGLMGDLGAALQRFDVDVVLLNDAPPALAQNVIAKGKLIFERSRAGRIAFQTRTLKFFLDTEPMRRLYLGALKRRYGARKARG